MSEFLDALFDAVDAKSDFARQQSEDGAEEMEDDIDALVSIAARRGSTREGVLAAARKLERKVLLLVAAMAVDARALVSRTIGAQARAAGVKRSSRVGPVRSEHLEERRSRRRDDLSASAYPALDWVLRAAQDAPGFAAPQEGGAPPPPPRSRILGHPGQPGEERMDAPRLPSLEELAGKSNEEILRLLRRLGLDVDEELLLAEKLASSMGRLIGARFPDDALIEQVARSARNRVRQSLVMQVKAVLRAMELASHRASGKTRMIWVSVLDKGTCESCEGRHNESKTLDAWEREGLTGSLSLICDGACRCELLPDDWFEGEGVGESTGAGGISVTLTEAEEES